MTEQRGLRIGILLLLAILAAACSAPDGQRPREPAAAAKVFITEAGMYEIGARDLGAAGLGWQNLNPEEFRLFYQGREQPLWVVDAGDEFSLRFYGQASESRYAAENVYWLQPGGGTPRRMEEQTATQATAGANRLDHFIATAHAEQNKLYAPRVEEGDHWFWAMLPAPRSQTFEIMLTDVAPTSDAASMPTRAKLRIGIWASSEGPESPDHHLLASVNGHQVADEAWDGAGRHIIQAELPADLLAETSNTVDIDAPGDTGAAADITYVDWIEIDYPRQPMAEADRLAFESTGGQLQVTEFSGPAVVFDVTNPQDVSRITGIEEAQRGSETAVSFYDKPNRRYLAIGPSGYRKPTRIVRAVTQPDLRAAGSGADYVAVGPPDLLEPLQPLLQWREEQGLQVMAIPVEAVYDQFNHGLPEPEAIRAFLKYAVQAWQPAPQYLLLVGDATYDTRGYQVPPEANRLPTFLVSTVFGGETASDTNFGQLNDDPWPDIAVGRMPARTPDQVRTLAEKILEYEQQAKTGEWRRRILAIADGQEPSFQRDAQAFVEQLPANYQAVEVYPPAGAAGANEEIRREINEGNLLVAYFGHGSVTQWGKDRLFTVADSATLANGDRLPVVMNMTCLTGLFTHPEVDSLAETLLWQEGGGAVAVLAPTSLTLPTDQRFLSRALEEALLSNQRPTLGQAFLQAQQKVPMDDPGTRDVMHTFLLFGDPALQLAYP